MTDEELVEKVARGLCSRVLSDIEIADSAEAVIDNSWRAYVADAETALAIARHIIEREALEKAAKVADDEDQKSAFKFSVGDHVRKPSGYAFDGIVRSAFMVSGGDRYVVESEAAPGLLHIFNGSQLEQSK